MEINSAFKLAVKYVGRYRTAIAGEKTLKDLMLYGKVQEHAVIFRRPIKADG